MITGRFARHQRLIRSSEFQLVFSRANGKCSDRHISLLGRENGLNFARLGLAIPKRYIKQAVARNRIKRLIRESFRQHQQWLTGLDIVVITHSSVIPLNSRKFFMLLEKHWQDMARKCRRSS